jgi:hypothetical protein
MVRKNFINRIIGFTVFAGAVAGAAASAGAADMALKAPVSAIGSCSEFVFQCENGRSYPLCPIALTIAGEVVTASLHTAPGHASYVRLVPMGVGYRYAGKGIWLDGLRGEAILNVGHRPIACSLVR